MAKKSSYKNKILDCILLTDEEFKQKNRTQSKELIMLDMLKNRNDHKEIINYMKMVMCVRNLIISNRYTENLLQAVIKNSSEDGKLGKSLENIIGELYDVFKTADLTTEMNQLSNSVDKPLVTTENEKDKND